MDYSNYYFKNKPSIEEILKDNIFIVGPTGSGKSVLLHQIIDDIRKLKNKDDYEIYIHDPKMSEFHNKKEYSFAKEIITSDETCFGAKLILESFANTLVEPGETIKKIIVISDEIGSSPTLEEQLMELYLDKSINSIFILASQSMDTYHKYKDIIDQKTVFVLKGDYGEDSRLIEIKK